MNHTPSLLDWLGSRWRQPWARRAVRFALAALVMTWGLNLWLAQNNTGGIVVLVFAAALGAWALNVRGSAEPLVTLPGESTVSVPSDGRSIASGAGLMEWLAPLRLPAVLVFPIIGQFLFLGREEGGALVGLAFYALGLALFGVVVWQEKLLTQRPETVVPVAAPITVRWTLVAISLLAAGVAYFTALTNRFTTPGVLAWGVSVLAWLGAVWEGEFSLSDWRARVAAWRAAVRPGLTLHLSWVSVLVLAAIAAGAYFRFADLTTIPPEMTSDHVEKLLDVADVVLDRQYKIFFERNTGREPLQFYLTALVGWWFDTGISHLSLKIGTALLGFLMLPFVFLLGRELEDDVLGLLALALAAMSFWHTAISRVGLRFPLYPLFVAPVLYFLFRGLRRHTRNDFVLAGLVIGLGLYGYSPFRVMVPVTAVLIGWHLLWSKARAQWSNTLTRAGLMYLTALIVFVPLLSFAVDQPAMFWERTASRLAETEQLITSSEEARQFVESWTARFGGEIPTPVLQAQLFLHNNWNGLRMFNWQGDGVWVNTLPGEPVLDAISGALLVLGAGFLLARWLLKRDHGAGALLGLVPLLLLPSTLSLVFPNENPSAVRGGGAIPVIFIIAAYPLWLLIQRLRTGTLGLNALRVTGATLALTLGGVFVFNRDMYFERYSQNYILGAQNASEVGEVIHDFANTFGSYDTAWVRPFPHWVDTRAVGMYSGNLRRDYAIELADIALTTEDPRAKLFILNAADVDKERPDGQPPTLNELRRVYPTGQVTTYRSARPGRDFLIYFVPAQPGATN